MPTADSPNALQALLDAAVDAIILTNHRGQIETFNPAAQRIFGYSAAEAQGQNISLLMSSVEAAQHGRYMREYLRTGVTHIIGVGREVMARRKDGSEFPVFLSVGRIGGSEPPRFVGFLHDVSESRRAELELQEARDRMLHVSRLATMGEMATSISHEINQPLAAIANYAQAASRFLAAPQPDMIEVREALTQIAGQALRAGEIVRRLRGLMRDRVTQREVADINETIQELRALIRADAHLGEVRVTFDLAEHLPPVNMDRIQIQQVLLNLLRNAVDSLQSVPPEQRQMSLRTTSNAAGDIEISVTDNGPGVAADMLSQLFTAFSTNKESGTGLGLAISRTIVEAHHGRLEHRGAAPHGATFLVTLPAEQEQST